MRGVCLRPSDEVPSGWGVTVISASEQRNKNLDRVVVSAAVHKEAAEILEAAPGIRVEHLTQKFNDELLRAMLLDESDPVRGLIVRTQGHDVLRDNIATVLETEWLDVIVRAGIGVNELLARVALQRGIKLMNTPEANRDTVHRETVRRIKSMLSPTAINERETVRQAMGLVDAKWKTDTRSYEREMFENPCQGKTLLVVGTGGIGQRVAWDMNQLGMKVLFCELKESIDLYFGDKVSLEEGLKRADVITIHVNGEDQVLGEEEFALINPEKDPKEDPNTKKKVIFINTSRGKVVDGKALIKAVQEGRIDGAYVDVLPEEDDTAYEHEVSREMMLNPLIHVTRHMLGGREDALVWNATDAANKMIGALRSGVVVDPYGGVKMELPPHMWENGGPVFLMELINEDVPDVHDSVDRITKEALQRHFSGFGLNISGATTRESDYRVELKTSEEEGRIAFHLSRLHFPPDIKPELIQEIIRECIMNVSGLMKMRIRKYERTE